LEPIQSMLQSGRIAPAQIPKTGKPLYPTIGLGLFSTPQERLTSLSTSLFVILLHTTLEYAGVWDLVKTRSPRFAPLMTYNTPTAESLYLRWLSTIIMIVECQGHAPWYDTTVGHLTGTTALKILETIKFVLFDDVELPPSVDELF
jgi:hypothetical protein